ncbi:DUF2306 domain-containing protein [Paenibacillus algorifonticola]|uniref:DUF2306 domain-containing protein n=1 Tax=Paenibacillus algorifonticola TaxID=684063 RepID=UPI003D2B58F5
MKSLSSRTLYSLMVVSAVIYIGYVVYQNFFYDPQATAFLEHKTKRPTNAAAWLIVMYVHIVFASLAMVSGAVNFSGKVLARFRKLHRVNGYVYLIAVLVVVLSSGYMAPYTTGGKINSIPFNIINMAWTAMTITAIVQIRKNQVVKHRKWMVRSYVFCFTNMFIHSLTFVSQQGFGLDYVTSYTIGIYGSMVLNLLIAELVIQFIYRRRPA